MMNTKEYATSRGISYEAVRKQLAQHKDELKEHTEYKGRTLYFDDYVVEFLDAKRAFTSSSVTIANNYTNEALQSELEALRAENKALLVEVAEVNKKLAESRQETIDVMAKYNLLLEDKTSAPEVPEHRNVFSRIISAIRNR